MNTHFRLTEIAYLFDYNLLDHLKHTQTAELNRFGFPRWHYFYTMQSSRYLHHISMRIFTYIKYTMVLFT